MAKGERELQVATHQLVVVFLGLIGLCVFVFLLGISMGSKRTALAAKAGEKADRIETPAGSGRTGTEGQALDAAGIRLAEPVAAKTKPADKPPAQPETKPTAPAAAKPSDKPADKPAVKPAVKPVEKPAVKAPADKPEAKVKPAAAAAGWYVQVAASDKKPDAETLAEKLEKDGYPVLVMDPLARDKKSVYRVRVGPYENKALAEEAKAKLAAAAKKKTVDYFLVKG